MSARGGGVCSGGLPGGDPPGTATAAGGTHPTRMHSCFDLEIMLNSDSNTVTYISRTEYLT